jgi:hypothetical protein
MRVARKSSGSGGTRTRLDTSNCASHRPGSSGTLRSSNCRPHSNRPSFLNMRTLRFGAALLVCRVGRSPLLQALLMSAVLRSNLLAVVVDLLVALAGFFACTVFAAVVGVFHDGHVGLVASTQSLLAGISLGLG